MSRLRLTWTDTPSRGLMATGLWVNICGHHQGDPAYQLLSGVQTDYLLIFTIGGEGWYRQGRRTYALGTGDALLVPPNGDHGYGTGPGGTWDILWIHMDGSIIQPLVRFWPHYPAEPTVPITRPEEMTRLLTSLLGEMAERRDSYSVLAAGYAEQALRLLIVDARRGRAATAPGPAQALVHRIQEYINQHLAEPLTLGALAAHAHVSPAHLCRTFKEETGFSPVEYSIKQRLHRAKELLHATSLPVAEVAQCVGYEDPAYFTRAFRAATGLTPRTFRRARIASSTAAEPGSGTANTAGDSAPVASISPPAPNPEEALLPH